MAKLYTKNTWVDEVLAGNERYDILEDGGTPIEEDAQIVLSTAVTQAGTPANATRMNNIEDGIDAIDDRLDPIHTRVGGSTLIAGAGNLVGTTTSSMDVNTAISFTPPNNQGMILIWRRSLTVGLTVWGLVYYNAGATAFTAIAVGGANLEVRTGVLTGTTGTSGKLTVSAHTDGKIYVENRVVTGITLHYLLLGG